MCLSNQESGLSSSKGAAGFVLWPPGQQQFDSDSHAGPIQSTFL